MGELGPGNIYTVHTYSMYFLSTVITEDYNTRAGGNG